MGNVGSDSFDDSIRLSDEARIKLTNFVLDLDGKYKESLHYIVLEGNCVLTTITRSKCWNKRRDDKLNFIV